MIQVEEKNHIATVTLNRPEVRNAFHPQMIAEITKAFRSLGASRDLRAIVLRGEGKVFCAGADLNWMKEMVNYSLEENKKDSAELFEMFKAISESQVPVIAVVHGAAFGGALGLIAAADYVIAEEKTQLCFSEVKLGIVPAVISHFVLKKTSLGVVAPSMLTGKVFSPKSVQGTGLIHEVVNAEELDEKLSEVTQLFLQAGPEAVKATKKLIHHVGELSVTEAAAETGKVIAERRVSREGQEGLQGFLEKRKPDWVVKIKPGTGA
jgi:methylglutaconyl-CoA hydratase